MTVNGKKEEKLQNPNRELNCKSKVIHPQSNQKTNALRNIDTTIIAVGCSDETNHFRVDLYEAQTQSYRLKGIVAQLLTNIINQRAHASATHTHAESGRVFWRGHKRNPCEFFCCSLLLLLPTCVVFFACVMRMCCMHIAHIAHSVSLCV